MDMTNSSQLIGLESGNNIEFKCLGPKIYIGIWSRQVLV